MFSVPASSFLFLGLCLFAIADALGDAPALGWAAVGGVVAFLAVELRRMPRTQGVVALVLGAAGAAAAALGGSPVEAVLDGIRRTLPFLLLFAAVTWLQPPAGASPSLLAVRELAMRQPPGRRFAYLGGAAHFLGVAFNLAGLSLLTPTVAGRVDAILKSRLSRAMAQGFSAGTCWSPFFVGTAVIVGTVPGVRWIEILPLGLLMAILLVAWSWVFDRLFIRRMAARAAPTASATAGDAGLPRGVRRRIAVLLTTLFGATIALVEGVGLSIPVSLAIVAPPFAMLWRRRINTARPETEQGAASLTRAVLERMPDLRGETALFTGANILGVGVATLLTPEAAAAWLGGVTPGPLAAIPIIALVLAVASAAGLHPVVIVVLITAIFPAETLGVAPQILALTMMCMWGQGTNASPFSATVLFLARVTGVSNWTVAWRWNGPYLVTTTVLVSAVMMLAAVSGLYSR